jgi:uncharacterized protein (TIGR00730 family)
MSIQKICVYASSSDAVDEVFFSDASKLGELIAENGYGLIYGGAKIGLMGEVAEGVLKKNSSATGVIPKALNIEGIVNNNCTELIITENMRERKKIMEEGADAFITLPGGFGTLEEILEIIASKQLGFHNKPVVILNTDGYYDMLVATFENLFDKRFTKEGYRYLYYVASSPSDAINYIKNYTPFVHERKWF